MSRGHVIVAVCMWVTCVGAGLYALAKYDFAPGQQATLLASSPLQNRSADGKWRLMVFAHPQCPCTRATLAEVERIAALCGNNLSIDIQFVRPVGAPRNWMDTDQVRRSVLIAGATVNEDGEGRVAASFGAETSGYCVLISPTGERIFQGGLTSSRAMEGDSLGKSSILDAVLRGRKGVAVAPVFGCSLGTSKKRDVH